MNKHRENMNKHLLFIILLLILSPLSLFAKVKSMTIDGVKYTINGVGTNATVSVRVVNKYRMPVNLIIPQKVVIDNREYPVTKIESRAFADCERLVSIVIPNSVTKLGEQAFYNCSSLINAVLPDDAKADIYKGDYGFGKGGIFKGCTALQDVRGTTIPYPKYVVYETIFACDEVPFYQLVQKKGAVTLSEIKSNVSFNDFALERVKQPVEEWQKRKEYETLAQWESRVTDANRSKMINEYMAEARINYIKDYAPTYISGNIESYNEDYQFFVIETTNLGTIYASVPASEKDAFQKDWDKVQINPKYGILDGQLAIIDCTFNYNDKTYNTPQKYDEDDFTQMAVNITPLSALKEYENLMASEGDNKNKSKHFDPDVIDIDIPLSKKINKNTFAVIIGNEDYQRVAPVEYAMNDARIFAKYCNRTLGIPEKNVRSYYNATYGDIVAALEDIKNISDAFNGDINVIFYYAGHGVPDESNRNAYLLPIDATGTQIDVCYPLDKLYSQLGNLNAKYVAAFIDACFSGSLRGEGMLASARGIRLRPRDVGATGNLVVISAASADQSAFPYHEKNHGLITYFLLKKLYDNKGEVTFGDLADYISAEVSKQSIVENKKPQKPSIKWSINLSDKWRKITLK